MKNSIFSRKTYTLWCMRNADRLLFYTLSKNLMLFVVFEYLIREIGMIFTMKNKIHYNCILNYNVFMENLWRYK